MPGKAVQVTLASGKNAVLPDGRKAIAGSTYNVSFADFQRIAPSARETMFSAVTIVSNAASAYNGTDLTINNTTVPSYHVLGEVLEGTTDGDLYQLVKLVDISASAGQVVTWANLVNKTVTIDRVGGSAMSPHVFAGVVLATNLTAGRYGYIQIAGEAPSLRTPAATTAAGTTLKIHATTDGGTAAETDAQNSLFTTTAVAVSSLAPGAFVSQSPYKQKRRLKNYSV